MEDIDPRDRVEVHEVRSKDALRVGEPAPTRCDGVEVAAEQGVPEREAMHHRAVEVFAVGQVEGAVGGHDQHLVTPLDEARDEVPGDDLPATSIGWKMGGEEEDLHRDRRAALSISAGSDAGGPPTSSQNTGTLCTRLAKRPKSSRSQVGYSGRQLGRMRVNASARRAGSRRGAAKSSRRNAAAQWL